MSLTSKSFAAITALAVILLVTALTVITVGVYLDFDTAGLNKDAEYLVLSGFGIFFISILVAPYRKRYRS